MRRGADQPDAGNRLAAPRCRRRAGRARARAICVEADRRRCSRSPRRARSRRRCSACRPRTCTAASFQVVFSNVTERIMSPPPMNGGIASSSASLAVQHADAGRAVQLVAGRDVEVAVERLHVDRHVIRRLRAVDQHRRRRARARCATISATGLIVPSAFDMCVDRDELRPRRRAARSNSSSDQRRRDRRSARRAAARRAPRTAAATARCSSGAPSPR